MKDYNFLDANTFIGRTRKPEPMWFHTKTELLEEMDYYHLNEAIVTHALARDYKHKHGNSLLMDELQGEERLYGCWVLPVYSHPDEQPIEEMVADMLAAGKFPYRRQICVRLQFPGEDPCPDLPDYLALQRFIGGVCQI